MRDHESALDYDLMTRTGRTLDEYMDMGAAGIVALVHFIAHLDVDSALMRDMDTTDVAEWGSNLKTNVLLADVFDAIAMFNHNFATAHSKHKPQKPKPYPRPWAKEEDKIGKGAIPISQFWEWWSSKEK